MRNYIFICCLLMLVCSARGQKKVHAIRFSNITSLGILSGESQNVIGVTMINGIKYKSNYAGLGVSYDPYGYHSLPVFLDLRKSFTVKSWQPFLYNDAGINFPYYSKALPKDYFEMHNRLFEEAGIGINKNIDHNFKIVLSAGYSYKHFNYTERLVNVCPNCDMSGAKYDFYYNRIAMRLGLQF